MAPWNNGGHPQGCPAPEEQEGLGLLREALGFLLPEQQAYFALGYYQMCAKLEKDRRERKAAAAAAKKPS